MKLKKIIASILAICMVLSTTSFPVYAEEATAVATVDGVEYTDIQTAITAAAPNKTVEVLSDIVVDEWKMFWQGDRTFKEIIYIDMDGLTINGNGHTLTVNNIVSATNGDQLFKQAKKLNITNWEIVQPAKKGGISLVSGTLDGVTFHGGNGVFPGDGEIVIYDCTFNTDHYCIYSEEENNGLKVTNSTFDGGDENNVIFLRGNTEFTGNTIVSGAKVRVVSGSPVVSGNDFGDVIVKVYNNATATIEDNTINNIEIDEPTAEVNSTFGENILSEEAETTLKEVGVIEDTSVETVVAQVGDTTYTTLSEAIDAAQYGDTVTLLSDLTIESDLNSAAKGYFNIAEEDKITLDLGGKTINVTDNSTGNFILFYNYGDLTIKNGMVNLTATNNREWNAESAIILNRGGNLTIESGTYTHNGGTDMAFVVDNSGNYYGDAITDIEGGTLTSAYIAIRNRMEQNSHGASGKATLNISGGTITGTKRAVWAQAASTSETSPATGAINVTGGEVGLIDTARSSGAECMTTISGGTVAEFKGEAGELTVTENGTITGTVTILTASGEEVDYVVDENGVYVEAPTPVTANAYVAQDTHVNGWTTIWGQLAITGTENFYVEIYSGETYLGKTTLVDTGKVLLDGTSHDVTWHAFLDGSDSWWNTEWVVGPVSNLAPTDVKFFIDGEQIGSGVVKMSSPDDLKPVVWEELRGVSPAPITGLEGEGTEENPYLISSLAELKWFRDDVNGGNRYAGKYIKLTADIDLNKEEWAPIGTNDNTFQGHFDGDNHTISNLSITGYNSYVGLFGRTNNNGSIKNLTLNNAQVSGRLQVGALVGTPSTFAYSNIKLTGHVEVNGMSYVGGVGGKNAYGNWTDITVSVDETSYVKATSTENGISYRTYVGGVIGFNGEGGHTFKNITSNIDVIGDVCDIGGIFGIAHYGNNFENITCTGDVSNDNDTADKATDVLETGLIAGVWHNQAGKEVKFTNINATGTITATYVPEVSFVNGGLIGNAYNANNETADTSGSLIIDGKEVWLKVAKIGDTGYASLADAVAAVKAGETITMLSDATLSENVTLPAGITFNGNGKTITGNIVAGGDLTFEGYTKVTTFNAGYNKPTITIGEGATLETTSGRMVIGHGATFNITGSITNAKTADASSITPSLIAPGASFTGAGVNFNVTNAYVKFTYYCSSKDSNASGTYNLNVTNSIWEQTNKFMFSVPTGTMDPTFNFTVKDSVLNTTGHLVFAATKGEIVFDNSSVNEGIYRQLENRSNLTIKNGSVVYASVQTSSNAKNPGTTTVDNATYVTTGTFGGSDVGTGTLILQNEARFTTGTLAKVNVTVDGTSLLTATKADTTTTTVTVDGSALEVGDEVKVIDLNGSASIEGIVTVQGKGVEATYGDDGDVTITKKAVPVASVTDAEGNVTNYTDLQTALKALTAGATLTLLDDVTITEAWDCRYNGAKITVPVTIDGNEHTLKLTGSVDDKNWDTVFRFEADATVKNLTIDASEATGIQRGISAKYSINVDKCILIGNGTSAKRAIIFGEGAGAELSNVTATITNTEFINWSYGVSDNQSGKDANSVSITDSTFNNASVLVSAAETVTFTGNTVKDGYVNITSYTASDTVIVTATGNTLEGTDDEIMVNPENITADDAFITPVAKIGSKYYETLEKAVSRAANGDTITLISDIVLSETITIPESANITLDLNGKNVTYNSTVQGEAMITNKGTLVINDSVGTGVINYNYTGAADSSYGKGNYTISNGGTLTVNGGKITIANLRAHAKYPIDNNSTTGDAILVINGGHLYNYNTSAIRQFCNSTTYQNSVTINGGLIEGYSAIWVQNPGSKTVNGTLSITGGEIRTTAAAYVNGTAALKDVASRLYCTIDGNGGAWSETSSVSITGGTFNENVKLAVEAPAAITIDIENAIFNGLLEIPAPELPTATVTKLENEELTFALNFEADEATPEQLMYYGNWYADFVLTVNKDVTFNANGGADGFLSGQYDTWSENWVNVPFEDVTLEAGESLRIMEYAAKLMGQPGLKFTYKDVYDFVKNFDCGVFFEDEFLAENPDLEVTLELRIYNSADESESYAIGETYSFEFEGVAYNTVTKVIYEDVSDALLAAKANETVILLADAEESMVLVTPGVTLDLNGYSLTSGYVSSFGNIVDSSEKNTSVLKVDSECFMIREDNAQLPVKDEGGYRFFAVKDIKQVLQDNNTTFKFLPYFDEELHELLLEGQDITGVTVNVRLSWTQDQGVRSQDFVYYDEIVSNVIGSYNATTENYDRLFTLTVTGTEGLEDLCFEVAIVSDTGVEITSQKLSVQTTVNK